MISVFVLCMVGGISLFFVHAYAAGGLLVLCGLAMACWIGKEIAEANDPSNNSK